MRRHIQAGQLGPEHIGQLVEYDADEPTIYGGKRPHPDGDPEHFLITLDDRELEGYNFDDVWVD